MIFLILSWKDRRTPRFLLDVVGSHKHNSQKCMNCWFVLTFQQRSVWSQDDCHMSKGFYGKNSTHKQKQGVQQFQLLVSSKKSSFFYLSKSTGWTIRSPWSLPTCAGTSYALSLTVGNPPASNVIGANQWKLLGLKNKICFWVERINFVLAPMYMLNKYSN